jgi:protein-S-isoprenylcysteine O-methyltransferase Ste14
MKTPSFLRNLGLLSLAIIFSIALMFAFVELPVLIDSVLAEKVEFPGLDHGRDAISAYKADIYISALNLRWIGYACLAIVILFIIVGFITRRSAWGLAGAFTLFLPVFGQFAMSMFFLSGLGMLRVGWMPFWDISWNVLDMGDVIYVPFWILMWVFRQFDYWAQPEIAWAFMGLGAFLFTWGVLVWMQARFSKKGVAISWIYRISRHPQYLGWIIWSYGLAIYSPLVNDMKKSWGMASSLPLLLMIMIIIGMCLLEEIRMREKYGEQFESYRKRTPFLFPLPGWLKKILKFPMWIVIRKPWPEKGKEVASVIMTYTIILLLISLIWVDFGNRKKFPFSESKRQAKVELLLNELEHTQGRRYRWFKFQELKEYGEFAVPPLIEYLESDNPEDREFAASILGDLGDTSAIRPLHALLEHPWDNVRTNAIGALVKLGDRSIIPMFEQMLDRESSSYPRTVIYNAIGDLQATEAWNLLVRGTQEEEDWVKMTAVRAMAKIDAEKTTPYLIYLLQSESDWVKTDASAIAHLLKDTAFLPYLVPLLDNDNYEVRFFAQQAIREINKTAN